jgi:hypothetical protein
MPRWASLTTLLVKRVWIERLQDISSWDAIAEGCCPPGCRCSCDEHRQRYLNLWDVIYGKTDFKSSLHPFVFACEFEVKGPADG